MKCIAIGAVTVMLLGAGPGASPTKREQIRAFVQVCALEDLAKWEAGNLYPDNETMSRVEVSRASRQARAMVAGQYEISVHELGEIVARGREGKWPRLTALEGGEGLKLHREDKPRGWRRTIWPREAQGQMKFVRDRDTNRTVAESVTSKSGWFLQYDKLLVPGKGKYRITLVCVVSSVRPRKGKAPFVEITVLNKTPGGWRYVAQRRVEAKHLPQTHYGLVKLEGTFPRKGPFLLGIRQSDLILRLHRIMIERAD